MKTILVIEDDKDIAELLETYLVKDNYSVLVTHKGTIGLKLFQKHKVDLVLLDLMLPEVDGLEICMQIRKHSNVPIIILSAKSQDLDKITGLSMGADDYLTKPFNPMELLARVKSQLRRYTVLNDANYNKKDNPGININGLHIDPLNHKIALFDEEIQLTPTEFDILYLLAYNSGRVFSSEEIFQRVWKEKYYDSRNTVMVHMWRLREKIESDPKNPRIIQTVWGVGYKIET